MLKWRFPQLEKLFQKCTFFFYRESKLAVFTTCDKLVLLNEFSQIPSVGMTRRGEMLMHSIRGVTSTQL